MSFSAILTFAVFCQGCCIITLIVRLRDKINNLEERIECVGNSSDMDKRNL